ncbi:hypothetical protein NKI65_35390 [Mesorhizobium sp. M0578]
MRQAIRRESRPKSFLGAAFIAAIWIGMAAFLIWLFWSTGTAATPA